MRGIIENNGAVLLAPDPSDSISPGVTYARILTLRHNGEANGTLLATCDLTTLFNGHQVWPIFRSTDQGVTWERIADMWDSTAGFTRQMNPFLFELPQKIGDLEAGTILLAGNLKPDDESTTNIMIFYSTDLGITWTHLSTLDSGGPAIYDKSPESTTTALWEPFLAVSKNGDLVCYYSDERQKDKGILQAQVQKISTDGGKTWGELQNVVGIPNRSDRPGMITMVTLPDGRRFATYEVVNRPSLEIDGAQVYFKFSPDGVTWDSEDIGTPILLPDGRGIGSSPYVIWVNDGTKNGMIVVGSKWALDQNGFLMQGQNFFVNRILGEGYWERLPMAVVFDSLDDRAYLTGLSMSMETDIDNEVIFQAVNVQNDVTNLNDLRVGAIPIHFTNYEAEKASLTNINIVNQYDASNEQKVGGINYEDSSIVFTNIEATTYGDYTILIRYNNGTNAEASHKLIINNQEPRSVVYPPTKDWGRFGWVMVSTNLAAGINTVAFNYSEGFSEIDCIWVLKNIDEYIRHEETDRFRYSGGWSTRTNLHHSNGIAMETREQGGALEFAFYGTAFRIIGMKGITEGTFDVYIDGEFITNIDLYNIGFIFKATMYEHLMLENGVHKVKLVAHTSGSDTRYRISIDAVDVKGTLLNLWDV